MSAPEGSTARESFLGALDVSIDLPLAAVGSRALAAAIDTVILVVLVLTLFAAATLGAALVPSGLGGAAFTVVLLAAFLLQWGYFVLFEQLMQGQSPGKRAVGLRVVMGDATPPTPLASLIRNLIRVVDFLPASYGIGATVALLDRRARRFGDMAAGTLVLREEPPPRERSAVLRWPEGFRAEDVALVETYFEAIATLIPDRREELAARLARWLRREYPEFAEQADEAAPYAEQVRALFMTPPPSPGTGPESGAATPTP